MKDAEPTRILIQGLILGNEDVTDEAQAELRQSLLEQELRAQLPPWYTQPQPQSTP